MINSNKLGSKVNNSIKLMTRLSALALVALVSISLVGCDDGSSSSSSTSDDETAAQIEPRYQEPQTEPAPAPTTAPISPFYGDRHGQAIGH
ncbi:hypothetical protein [Chamaesiphon sp.]|uniref:hypothetical protein n=1 Tax=Chamaesiphon sp. TaxID=2814140 RepID=UPI003593D0D6